jgi:hypothetical protein
MGIIVSQWRWKDCNSSKMKAQDLIWVRSFFRWWNWNDIQVLQMLSICETIFHSRYDLFLPKFWKTLGIDFVAVCIRSCIVLICFHANQYILMLLFLISLVHLRKLVFVGNSYAVELMKMQLGCVPSLYLHQLMLHCQTMFLFYHLASVSSASMVILLASTWCS